MDFIPLTQTQIRSLEAQGCSAERWDTVRCVPQCDLSRIQRVRFVGEVRIGSTEGSVEIHGVPLPCGLYDATIIDCTVGNGVRVAGVRIAISRYRIESGACIQDVGIITADPGARFGNGIEFDVINEGGGRTVTVFNRLTSQVACMQALFRHNPPFLAKLKGLIDGEINTTAPTTGVIGENAHIIGCAFFTNVVVGPAARCEGVARLENGTINSCPEHPTFVGSGVHAREFVLAEGASVDSGALVEKAFVGQGVRMGKQYSAESSLYFANCEMFLGEGVSLFAGPFTVSHHKSTLMIAGIFSFYNAGSGTNQSNHMYKLGPVHQGIFERGSKTGSFSYVLFESHISAFTVVIGKHLTNIRVPNLPFSYISEKGGESTIIPGMNLFAIGMVRDGEKWPKRDTRKAPERRDLIVFDVFSPYTVEKMRRGREELLALNETTPKEKASVLIGGVQMNRPLLRKGAKYYASAVLRYLYGKVLGRLADECGKGKSWDEAVASLTPASGLRRAAEWTDVSGLLIPVEVMRTIEEKVAAGTITSYNDLLTALRGAYDAYRQYEWQYVMETFGQETGIALPSLTKALALQLVDDWQKVALSFQSSILEDSKKEFGPLAKIGYGLDRPEAEMDSDFAAVRGSMETNAVVQKMAKESEHIAALAAEWKQAITASR